MIDTLKRLDKFMDKHAALVAILAAVVILRIPNLCEPYWYGDEAIYLTIGQALNEGHTLYKDIIDHKTPIIYYLARVDTQLNFRILNIVWMTISTLLFYVLSRSLFKKQWQTVLATAVFALLTTMPWLEGNLPNGELFVLGFVLAGAVLLLKTKYWQNFLTSKPWPVLKKTEAIWIFLAGAFFSLGILTKVPAIFDLAAFMVVGWFGLFLNLRKNLVPTFQRLVVLGLGVLVPILFSIIYFVLKGAGPDYLQFGLLYNFHYAGNWGLNITNPVLTFLFTLPGKAVVVASSILLMTVAGDKIKPVTKFVISWFLLSLMASLLSNRPYQHYFIQVVPAFSLLVALGINGAMGLFKKFSLDKLVTSTSLIIATAMMYAIIIILEVWFYPVGEYYSRWYSMVTGQISQEEYRDQFNSMANDNYKLAKILKTQGQERLFIWGTNPMLYALSHTTPTGRFTVSFHIKDINTYDETLNDLIEVAPLYIVVMNDEDGEFPEFYSYLNRNYRQSEEEFDHFKLYSRFNVNGVY